jgi:structural maintenance of chromosome 4
VNEKKIPKMAIETEGAAPAAEQSFNVPATDRSLLIDTPRSERHQPATRLMIKQMVLENFKSYAGRVEIGPFHKVRRLRYTNHN